MGFAAEFFSQGGINDVRGGGVGVWRFKEGRGEKSTWVTTPVRGGKPPRLSQESVRGKEGGAP